MATFGIPQAWHQLRLACAILGLLIAVGITGACGADEERDPTGAAPIGGDETPRGESSDGADGGGSANSDGGGGSADDADGGGSADDADGGGDLPGPQPNTRPSTGPDRPDATPTDLNAPVAPDEDR